MNTAVYVKSKIQVFNVEFLFLRSCPCAVLILKLTAHAQRGRKELLPLVLIYKRRIVTVCIA